MSGMGVILMSTLKDKITEISMERTVCAGTCPIYTVTFKSDGTAVYEGKEFVDKIGTYVGKVDEIEFKRLAFLIEKLNFLGLKDNYSIPVADHANVIITVNYEDKVKGVDNYGDAGPVEVWAIEKVIDAMVEDIYWERSK